ncbi:MAG TPA: hypothetical protein VFI22_12685, partial [Thermomicrobiales bacterium]|nr:hypothetical protein [Thermomicrobiales bacterium]
GAIMNEPLPTTPDSETPAPGAPIDNAAIAEFLAEIEGAAERLRRLPLTDLTPEIPFRPQWTEPAT